MPFEGSPLKTPRSVWDDGEHRQELLFPVSSSDVVDEKSPPRLPMLPTGNRTFDDFCGISLEEDAETAPLVGSRGGSTRVRTNWEVVQDFGCDILLAGWQKRKTYFCCMVLTWLGFELAEEFQLLKFERFWGFPYWLKRGEAEENKEKKKPGKRGKAQAKGRKAATAKHSNGLKDGYFSLLSEVLLKFNMIFGKRISFSP